MVKNYPAYVPLLLFLCAAAWRVYYGADACKSEKIYKDDKQNFIQSKVTNLHKEISERIERILPSPHSELLLGMVVGIDNFNKLPKFEQVLKDTGTIHVVVVSGFNVSLVFNMVIKLIGSPYKKKNIIIGLFVTFMYSVISGFDPPVIRAWLMGSIASIGKYYGRVIDVIQTLVFTACILLIVNPCFLVSLSFQLSLTATLGLILFSDTIKKSVLSALKFAGINLSVKNSFLEDFSASFSAQMLVWPLISYNFGTVSLMSVVVNTLILWTVPLITASGFAIITVSFINIFMSQLFAVYPYVLIDFFVTFVNYFAGFEHVSLEYKMNLWIMVAYYTVVALSLYVLNSKKNNE